MSNIAYKILERRQKMQIKTYLVLTSILLLSMGFYTFQKWQTYKLALQGLEQNREYISYLGDAVIEEKSIYDENKPAFDDLSDKIASRLANIFPATDNYTELTRQIDNYEQELNSRNSTFAISSIDYQQPGNKEGQEYSVLPFRMNINSSPENFTKFLHLIEGSGSLDGDIRLMDISSIRLSFPNDKTDEDRPIRFSVQVNAYYQ